MSGFVSKRVVMSGSCKFNAGIGVIAPLLCPVREKEWLCGWDCEIIYSESGYNEKGCTWKNRYYGGDAIWTVVSYKKDPVFEFEAVIFVKGSMTVNFSITLQANYDGTSNAIITQTYTATSGKGNRFISGKTGESYKIFLSRVEKAMNYFLSTGKMLKGKSMHRPHVIINDREK